MKCFLVLSFLFAFSAPAHANVAQFYVDESVKYVRRSNIHLQRFLDSAEENADEYATYCRLGMRAVESMYSAQKIAKGADKFKLLDSVFKLKELYKKCGKYWTKEYGGVCDYDYKNKECLGKPW